jgi:hypothetical protein
MVIVVEVQATTIVTIEELVKRILELVTTVEK